MVSAINASGITVGQDGRVRISGVSSNIDSKAIIDAQVAARRASAVTLERKITSNTGLIAAYGELKTKAGAMTTALDKLRGNNSFTAEDVFRAKVATGTTAAKPTAPSGFVPSGINSILTASIAQTAPVGTHRITVQQLAQAQQIRGDVQTSSTAALGYSGSFTLNGKSITLAATDSLVDVRSKINAAGAGVNATLVSSGPTQNFLVLTSASTGTDAQMVFAGGGNSITDGLGLTAAGTVKNQLQAARNSLIDVNGITGIERQTNSIDNVLEGVTFSLTKAEPDTEITLKIEPDLNKVKTALNDFAVAFNELRSFIAAQRTASDRNNDGVVADDEFGPLAFTTQLRTLSSALNTLAATEVGTAADGFRSLNQIGISVNPQFQLQIDDSTLDNKLLTGVDEIRKLFALNYTSSDARLTFQGRGPSTAGGTYFVNLGGTDSAGEVVSGNIRTVAGSGLGGGADGTLTGTGATITATASSPASGLRMFFNAGNNAPVANQIQVNLSRGIADQFYDVFDETTRTSTGQLDTLITQIQQQNTDYQSRIDTIDARIETFKASLERRFVRMETALAQLEQLRSRIQQFTDSQNGNS